MPDKYTPPPRLIWESVNGALDITTQLCKDLRAEIKELKETIDRSRSNYAAIKSSEVKLARENRELREELSQYKK